ncbi:dihydrolipoyl dehydrogenase family protein [Marinibacterium profundimaris]|uniref:Dihydrolipoamide dehydrogenase n=1 Tax=Marinibacterium profundimaris TaxID=1679460 RepID=A0A225NI61_9RHOB|nr:FAD-dependent oxidoreductase [Marinibacterium profundimaris]OWU73515.1 dihydrolipoamide dehydrogenase [Marinibacterium profundimaris]
MDRIETDILVIGAGSGGLSVAAGAVQMGARVVLVEGGEMGGDCLNAGCVPSKALIAAAGAAWAPSRAGAFGVTAQVPQVDYAAVMAHVQDVISTIAPVDSQDRFEGLGVRVIRAWARFTGPREVEAGGHVIRARRIVIATGSRPVVPPIPGLDDVDYLTNETLWDLRERPGHLMIVGGGPIGIEMAQAHRRLGCEVTVVDGSRALGREDPEMSELVLARLREEGVVLREGVSVSRVARSQASGEAGSQGPDEPGRGITLTLDDGSTVTGTHLLIATGRKVVTDGLGLEAAGVRTGETGIVTDAALRTSNRRVYAIGDAAGGAQFTHLAGYHGATIIRPMLFGLPAKARTDHIPRVTYADPELAQVGLTEAEAREIHGSRLEVARFDFADNDRAIASRRPEGLIKAMVVRGRPVGVSIVGADAGEHANLWALVLANRLKMSQISAMVSPYPTVGEVSKRVAGAYFSPKLFDSDIVKRVVGLVQRWVP